MTEERLSKIEKILLGVTFLAVLAGEATLASEKYEKFTIPSTITATTTYAICAGSILRRYQRN